MRKCLLLWNTYVGVFVLGAIGVKTKNRQNSVTQENSESIERIGMRKAIQRGTCIKGLFYPPMRLKYKKKFFSNLFLLVY